MPFECGLAHLTAARTDLGLRAYRCEVTAILSIRFLCPGCNAELSVPPEQAGRVGRCGQCGAVVLTPALVCPSSVASSDVSLGGVLPVFLSAEELSVTFEAAVPCVLEPEIIFSSAGADGTRPPRAEPEPQHNSSEQQGGRPDCTEPSPGRPEINAPSEDSNDAEVGAP